MTEAARQKSRNERRMLGAPPDGPTEGRASEAALAVICHELGERLTAIGNYVQAARRLRVTEPTALSVPRHVEILEKALAQIHQAGRSIAQFRRALSAEKPVVMAMTQKMGGPG
jgi:signal transduction histidine kinase